MCRTNDVTNVKDINKSNQIEWSLTWWCCSENEKPRGKPLLSIVGATEN
jgi:hypothetical protein